jgi:hypothetical protein
MPHDFELITRREHELPSVWHEGFVTLREHELREVWRHEHPGLERGKFDEWRAAQPQEFKDWAEPHVRELIAVREHTMADRLQALEVAGAEASNPGPAAPEAFRQQGANDLFKSLTEGERSRAKDHFDGLQAWAAEVRSDAGNLEGVAERVTEMTREAFINTHLEHLRPDENRDIERMNAEQFFEPIESKFKELGSALKEWNEAIGAAADPKGTDLEALARKVQEKVKACREIRPFDHWGLHKIERMEVVVPAALDAISAEVARQWQARAGEPSFTGMAFRLSERPAGDKIAPEVAAKFKDKKYAGDYRRIWAEGRDALLETLKRQDRNARNALMKELGTLDLGPSLDKWKAEADKLDGNFSLKRMQESILGTAYATETYLASVEKLVKDQAVLTGFRDLLNGLQLQLRHEVSEYRQYVTKPK